MKGLSLPVTESACAGKMQMFIRIFLRILPVATFAHPHISTSAFHPALFSMTPTT